MSLFHAQPLCLHPTRTGDRDYDHCSVHQDLWSRWITNQTTETLLVEVIQDEQRYVLTVDCPHDEEPNVIYLPSSIYISLTSQEVTVNRLTEDPPIATNIVLQPLDTELYHCDIATAVSDYLSHWNVLQKHTTLSVPCPELGGYPVDVFVQTTEPADCVLLRGEVPLNLAESLLTVPEWIPPTPTPPPTERPPTPIPNEPEAFLPIPWGGAVQQQQSRPPTRGKPAFVPFSGTGHRLG
jgi:hypothetical protein